MNRKIEPWRLVVGGLAILYIIYMWVKKDLGSITLPKEDLIPMMFTSITVTLVKVLGFIIIILLVKTILIKIKK